MIAEYKVPWKVSIGANGGTVIRDADGYEIATIHEPNVDEPGGWQDELAFNTAALIVQCVNDRHNAKIRGGEAAPLD